MTKLGKIELQEQLFFENKTIVRPFSKSAQVTCRMCSEPLERAIVDFGADVSFGTIPQKIIEHYGVEISTSTAQRVTLKHAEKISKFKKNLMTKKQAKTAKCIIGSCDGVMVPTVETGDSSLGIDRRKTRKLKWREARLSLAYEKGSVSKTYEATMGSIDEAGKQMNCCATRVGKNDKTHIHFIADGAPWIEDQVEIHFGSQSTFMIDFYHVSEYLAAASHLIQPDSAKHWLKKSQEDLKCGKINQVLNKLKKYIEDQGAMKEKCAVTTCLRYLEKRTHALDYKSAIENDLPIGSGSIESGNRHIIQRRLKLPGAWWKEKNAQSILDLRTLRANNDWNDYWSGRSMSIA